MAGEPPRMQFTRHSGYIANACTGVSRLILRYAVLNVPLLVPVREPLRTTPRFGTTWATPTDMRESGQPMRQLRYGLVEQLIYIAIAVGAGATNALQLAMLGGLSRERGGFESTFISMLASVAGLAILLVGMLLAGKKLVLPGIFRSPGTFLVLAVIMFSLLVVAAHGVPRYYLLTGLTSVPYLLAAAFVGSRLGLGVYFAAIVTGQMSGSLVFDHLGAFGADARSIDPMRLTGVGLLVLGVVLIRGR